MGPSNLAFSADGTQLLVENDTDGTVSVVNLADGTIAGTVTLTGVTTPMTANLAVSPDGTFAYAVSLPAAVVPGTTQASLTRIALPVAAGASAAPILATLPTPVTASGLGIAFTPDATLAYITTEGLTYIVTTSTNTISSTTIAANGGSAVVDQGQSFAYTVDVANKGVGGNTVVNKIPLSTNTPASLSPAPPCNLASSITVTPDTLHGYFTCPGADSVQLIDTAANSITSSNTLSLAVGTSPQGVAVTSNGAFAFVAGGDGSITSINTSVVPNTFTSFSDVGFPKKGLGFVPVLATVTPSPVNVQVKTTQPFAAALPRAYSQTVTWSLACAAGVASCGSIDPVTGVFTAPATVPTNPAVTIFADSTEVTSGTKKFFRGRAVATITDISIAISPAALTVNINATDQFSLTLVDTTNGGVTWTISCAAGVSVCGTINTTGLYSAPQIVPSPATVTVTATSNTDNTKSDSKNITIISNVVVTVTPPAGAPPFLIGQSYTFTAPTTGDANNLGVTWSMGSCTLTPTGSNPNPCGVIVATTGVYTAPPSTTPANAVHIQATSKADTSKIGTFQLTITSNVMITGFQVNGAAPPSQLLIETPSYTLTPVINGDTGQGVTWAILNCSASNPTSPKCGTINAGTGAYATPSIVPYAPPVTATSTAFITFQATSNADPSVSKTFMINIGSTVAITGYQVNGAAPPAQLLIETPTYTLTPVITNDTGQGVTWTILSCSASNPANASCGSFTNASTGAFAMPKIVPYALPVSPTSTASNTFQVTSVADPKVVFQPAAIGVASSIQLSMAAPNSIPVLIEKAVDFTPNASNGNVTLMNDTNQGVTLSITGTCFDPPNFVTSPSTIRCGSFNGNQTSSPPLYSYTAPSVVPLAAATPAASLGTAQRAVITITATSVADPIHTALTTFSISSNISFTIPLPLDGTSMKNLCNPNAYSPTDANFLAQITADPCGFAVKPLAPTLAFGFPAILVESNPQNFGTVTGLTWISNSGSPQPAFGTQTTFTAPPSSGNVTITGYAIADFRKTATFPISVVASKVIPHNIAPPFTLTVATGQSSGSILLDFMGPTSGQITFACPSSGFVKLPNSTCAFSPNPSNATGTSTVTMTLSVIRAVAPSRPPLATPLPGLPGAVLATILLTLLILAFTAGERARLHWMHAPHWNTAFVVLVLCVVILTWVGACNQFSAPGIPTAPISGVTSASGSATVTGTPTTDSSPSTDSLAVPASVQ